MVDPISVALTIAAVWAGAAIFKPETPKKSPQSTTKPTSTIGRDTDSATREIKVLTEKNIQLTTTVEQMNQRTTVLSEQLQMMRQFLVGGAVVLVGGIGVGYAVRYYRSRRKAQLFSPIPRIEFAKIEILQPIGYGATSNVWLARYDDQLVAVKRLHEVSDGIENEISIMISLRSHPHIVPIIGVSKEDEIHNIQNATRRNGNNESAAASSVMVSPRPLIVTEYQQHGGLDEFLTQRKVSVAQLLDIALQIAEALAYCHMLIPQVIHRDLAARNVFVAQDNPIVVKVGDFGLSRRALEFYQTVSNEIPWRWLGPDSLRSLRYSAESDIWMFGVVVWEIFTISMEGDVVIPWVGHDFNEGFVNNLVAGARLQKPSNCPTEVWELILRCWSYDPRQRPPMAAVEQELHKLRQLFDRS